MLEGFSFAWLVPGICFAVVYWFWATGAKTGSPLWPDGDPGAPGWYRDNAHHRESWAPTARAWSLSRQLLYFPLVMIGVLLALLLLGLY